MQGDLLRVAMLAALGNFVNAPGDHPGEIATVAVDVYSGRIVVVPPYSALRESFLETLLVISVLVIARLTFVRHVEKKVIEVSLLCLHAHASPVLNPSCSLFQVPGTAQVPEGKNN